MSQTAALRALDADIMGAMADAGFADVGTYTAPSGSPVPCTVYIDRNAGFLEQDGAAIAGNRIVIGILRADVDRPVRGGVITVDAETFELEDMVQRDESMQRWVVLP